MSFPNSPYPVEALTPEHHAEIARIRRCLTTWILAQSDAKARISGWRERAHAATQNLIDLEVIAPWGFPSSPVYTFQPVLLSCIRCYWMALVASFSTKEKEEIAKRLDITPSYGKRIPKFNGTRCVEAPAELSEKEYEGLMRTVVMLALGMVDVDVVRSWRELADVGVQTWEEY